MKIDHKKTKRGVIIASLIIAGCANSSTPPPISTNHYQPAVIKKPLPAPHYTAIATKPLPPPKPIRLNPHSTKVVTGPAAVNQANKLSIEQPTLTNYQHAISYFSAQPGMLDQIYCAPLHITDIEFQPGEQIISAGAGDTVRWQLSKTSSGSGNRRIEHLLIKPEVANISNTLVVTTDRRAYHLLLKSTDNSYMPIVAWRYPQAGLFIHEPAAIKNRGHNEGMIDPNQMDFHYQLRIVRGNSPDWMPVTVFNDGNKTYIQFPSRIQQAPTLFVINNGHTETVNYRVKGNYYIIDSVISAAQLRLGQNHPTIVEIIHLQGQ